jgi:hypothetical protein
MVICLAAVVVTVEWLQGWWEGFSWEQWWCRRLVLMCLRFGRRVWLRLVISVAERLPVRLRRFRVHRQAAEKRE